MCRIVIRRRVPSYLCLYQDYSGLYMNFELLHLRESSVKLDMEPLIYDMQVILIFYVLFHLGGRFWIGVMKNAFLCILRGSFVLKDC